MFELLFIIGAIEIQNEQNVISILHLTKSKIRSEYR